MKKGKRFSRRKYGKGGKRLASYNNSRGGIRL